MKKYYFNKEYKILPFVFGFTYAYLRERYKDKFFKEPTGGIIYAIDILALLECSTRYVLQGFQLRNRYYDTIVYPTLPFLMKGEIGDHLSRIKLINNPEKDEHKLVFCGAAQSVFLAFRLANRWPSLIINKKILAKKHLIEKAKKEGVENFYTVDEQDLVESICSFLSIYVKDRYNIISDYSILNGK
jgi:hypothetical protein